MRKYIFIALFVLSGCARPDVEETQKVGDQNMSCCELLIEMNRCETARKEIQDKKGVTGTNVAAVLFFWPAIIATHSNVNDASRALEERKNHLLSIYKDRGCHKY